METLTKAEVIIVGGGPVGITAGNLLGMLGIKTIIFEREETFYTYPRVAVIDDEALRTFQMMGLIEILLAHLTPGLYVEVFSRTHKRLITVRLPEDREFGFTRVAGILQQFVEEQLRNGLNRFDCVELCLQHNLVAVTQDPTGVTATFNKNDGTTLTITAPYLLACDGGRSTVRRLTEINFTGPDNKDHWLILDFIAPTPPLPIIRAYGNSQRAVISVPLAQTYQRMEFRLLPGEDPIEVEQNVEKSNQWIRPWFDPQQIDVVRRRVYSQSVKLAERFQDRRIFLLGDAAHIMPPFTGQGLCSGIRDATNLTWKLALVLQGLANEKILTSYETERRPHIKETLDGARMMGRILFPKNQFQEFIRDSILTIINMIPPARRIMEKVKPRPVSGVGLFIDDGIAGFMFIQPEVETNTKAKILLDNLLGKGFSILGFNVDPLSSLNTESQAFWKKLATKYVKILPTEAQFNRETEFLLEIKDINGILAAWFLGKGNFVVLRPDHYIAFTGKIEDINRLTSKFSLLLGPTP